MVAIRLQMDEVKLCVENAQLCLHGVRRNAAGYIIDHVDLILPWECQRAVTNLDAMNYHSSEDDAVS